MENQRSLSEEISKLNTDIETAEKKKQLSHDASKKIKEELDKILIRENRMELAEHCFKFLKHRVTLDLAGWNNQDIFAH